MFGIIAVTLFNPNTDADQQRSAELLARISKFFQPLEISLELITLMSKWSLLMISFSTYFRFLSPNHSDDLRNQILPYSKHFGILPFQLWNTLQQLSNPSLIRLFYIRLKLESNSALMQPLPFRRSRKRKQI